VRGIGGITLQKLGEDDAPALGRDELTALACWRFMGGWRPELLPAYAAVYPLADPEATIELLHTLRDERDRRR
jgi:hypothetical protein